MRTEIISFLEEILTIEKAYMGLIETIEKNYKNVFGPMACFPLSPHLAIERIAEMAIKTINKKEE